MGESGCVGIYQITINPALLTSLARPADLFAILAGGKKFAKTHVDHTNSYQQMALKESSQDLVAINTHRGLYTYTRLPFCVALAPVVFQQMMDTIIQGLPNVLCYMDDILVMGTSDAEHLDNLEKVLQRLHTYGYRANQDKCKFLSESVEYLGHHIDAAGLHTMDSKVREVKEAPSPRYIRELRSFLGLLHYHGRFLPNLADLLHPLNRLLQANSK